MAILLQTASYAPVILIFAGKLLISQVRKIHFCLPQVVRNLCDAIYSKLISLNNDVSVLSEAPTFLSYRNLEIDNQAESTMYCGIFFT